MKKPAATLITAVPLAAALAAQAMAQSTLGPARRPQGAAHYEHPRLHAEGRLLLAPREEQSRGHRVPRGRERLHRGSDAADEAAAGNALQGDARAHQADRPQRAVAHRRVLLLLAHGGRASSTRSCAAARAAWTAPKKSCSTSTQLAEGHKFLGLGAYAVSDDGNWLAYSLDTTGYRQYTPAREGPAHRARLGRDGSNGSARSSGRPTTRRCSTPPRTPSPSGPTRSGATSSARPERAGLRGAGRAVRRRRRPVARQEDHLPSARAPRRRPRCATCRRDDPPATLKVVLPRAGRPRVRRRPLRRRSSTSRTNKGAKNFQVVDGAVDRSVRAELDDLHRAQPGRARSTHSSFFARHIWSSSEREGGLSYLRVIDMKTQASHRIGTDEPDYALSPGGQPRVRHDDRAVQLPVDGDAVVGLRLRHDHAAADAAEAEGGARRLRSGRATSRERIWASRATARRCRSRWSTGRASSSTARRRCCSTPTARTASRRSPTFSSNRLSLLDRGVVFALAHIRGGGELGEDWHEQGRMMQKMNTFTRLHRLRRVPGQERVHRRRTGWSSRAAAPAAC